MLVTCLVLAACSSGGGGDSDGQIVRVAFLQDLTVPSHVDLVSPSFLSFDLALHNAIDDGGVDLGVEVVQMDTEGDPSRAADFAREIAADPTYVAAVAAPFWTEPDEVADFLAEAGVPTLSLSPQSRPPVAAPGLWRRFVPDDSLQVEALAAAIEAVAAPSDEPRTDPEPERVCIFAEDRSYSADLQRDLDLALPATLARTVPPPGDLEAAIADVDRGCSLVVWTGTPDGAIDLAAALHEARLVRGRPVDFGVDSLKTVIPPTVPNREGVVVGALTCPCTDVSTRRSGDVRSFVNTYQAANGLAPGIYAAEAWDAANVLARLLAAGARDRSSVASDLAEVERIDGLGGDYVFDELGELRDPRVALYQAAGSRWLRIDG